ncbi:MAG: VCBS domain-containing protein [Nitrosomonas sp.]|nr:VCBS domain-containing protein [Nitrosomonas sp.]
MNKRVSTVRIFLTLLAMLIMSGSSLATTGTFGNNSGGGSSTNNPTDTTNVPQIVGTLEQVVTVIKNEKPEVLGNLFCSLPIDLICPDSDPLSIELLSSPAGNYGFLDISGNEKFRYVLKNDLPQVQALGFQDVAEEVFYYKIKEGSNDKTNAKLTVYILGNPSVSFDNVEIEPNNTAAAAGPLHVGNAFENGQYMRGQLSFTGDIDWFVFNSLGNEIINLELCPEGSQCRDEEAWVMYVFDADKFAQHGEESKTYPVSRYIKETNELLASTPSDHLYLLLHKGVFRNSLVGVIDPCFGDRRVLDIGVSSTVKNYLVAITSPLIREVEDDTTCGSGDVLRKEEITATDENNKPITIVQEKLLAHFSDDQYTFRVTRTGADPFAVIQPTNTTFDATGRKVKIPKVRINDALFSATLEQLYTSSGNTPAVFAIQSLEALNEPLSADPFLPTYNPSNHVVKIPQVVNPETGEIFSVELLFQPGDGTLQLLKAESVN